MVQKLTMGQQSHISVIVPAYNEARFIEDTLLAVRRGFKLWNTNANNFALEMIVVDDGSTDATYDKAAGCADRVVKQPFQCGKGVALSSGYLVACGDIVVFLDADLGITAEHFPELIEPLALGSADMVIALLPTARKRGGFGIVKNLATRGVYGLSGFKPSAPLSGQRAVRRSVLERIGRFADGFGVEVGLTIDAVKLGFHVEEREIAFSHRDSGRDIASWIHRGQQFCAVGGTLLERWRQPIC